MEFIIIQLTTLYGEYFNRSKTTEQKNHLVYSSSLPKRGRNNHPHQSKRVKFTELTFYKKREKRGNGNARNLLQKCNEGVFFKMKQKKNGRTQDERLDAFRSFCTRCYNIKSKLELLYLIRITYLSQNNRRNMTEQNLANFPDFSIINSLKIFNEQKNKFFSRTK